MLKVGVRPVALVQHIQLLELRLPPVPAQADQDPYVLAGLLAELLTAAVNTLGDGPIGRSAQALFGTSEWARGLPLKARRAAAADTLDVVVSTYRKYYEPEVIQDVAYFLWNPKIASEAENV